jgi:Na+/proline symporter
LQVWNLLTKLSEQFPVDGNKGGSYLTMLSKGGFIFGIINIIGNFGTVYNDQVRGICLHWLLFPTSGS